MKFSFFLFIILCFSHCIWSQTKVEIEKRVNTDEVPEEALDDLRDNLKKFTKVKWYYQEDDDKKVYEAKFKQNSKKYSVEFDTEGEIYNIEVTIKPKDIKALVFNQIKSELLELFDDYKIRKIQREFLGESDDLFEIISENEFDEDLKIRYEMEVNAKVDSNRQLFEFLFGDDGKLISHRKVKVKSTDILDY